MKKRTVFLLLLLILPMLMLPVSANADPVITLQPQNYVYPEGSVAVWSVEATGENLSYTWYILYQGIDYCTLTSVQENDPWMNGITGDGFGWNEQGNVFYINGIGSQLDGAYISCTVTSGANDFTVTDYVPISVGGTAFPPEVVVPAAVTAKQHEAVSIVCRASAPDGDSVQSYLWYETPTGKLQDIVAIGSWGGGQEEDQPVLVCSTDTPGTRYYVCMVETALGGRTYSSVIPVTVVKAESTVPPVETTVSTPATSASDPGDASGTPATSASDPGTTASDPSEAATSSSQTDYPDAPGKAGRATALPSVLLIAFGGTAVVAAVCALVIFVKKK